MWDCQDCEIMGHTCVYVRYVLNVMYGLILSGQKIVEMKSLVNDNIPTFTILHGLVQS
jgi:hypothetical protein